MEFRSLRYFLMIAREGTILGAAKVLHVSQPALSRQMKDFERELGCTLFNRGSRHIELTEAGMRLRKRAEEIVDLMERTEADFLVSGDTITGEVRIGGGETPAVALIADAIEEVQSEYPLVAFNLYSGNGLDVSERLDMGRIDFGLFVGNVDHDKYETLRLPAKDTWGVIMRKDSALAQNATIKPKDLYDQPLILSQQALGDMSSWLGRNTEHLNVVATYNLLYNASILVSKGIGYALSLDGLVTASTYNNSSIASVGGERSEMLDLTFRPLEPPLEASIFIAWKRYQSFSPAAGIFLEKIKELWG
ncbi:MAG: LysR family transcriptional regulator [Eggerthellaceae bacterium]|nr:LysR family transcriptional regulator [Eggerthellaceae bacterium]